MSTTAPPLTLYLVTTTSWSRSTTVWAPSIPDAVRWAGLGPDVTVRICPVDADAEATQPPLPF
jgi:hypothetical protein